MVGGRSSFLDPHLAILESLNRVEGRGVRSDLISELSIDRVTAQENFQAISDLRGLKRIDGILHLRERRSQERGDP